MSHLSLLDFAESQDVPFKYYPLKYADFQGIATSFLIWSTLYIASTHFEMPFKPKQA